MKKLIAFAVVALVALVAFFGMEHFNGNDTTENNKVAAAATAEVTLPDLTVVETATPAPTHNPEPTQLPKAEVTAAPSAVPTAEVTEKVATIYLKTDAETGKGYYEADSQQIVVDYVRESVTAADAVAAIECVNYGASMVVEPGFSDY